MASLLILLPLIGLVLLNLPLRGLQKIAAWVVGLLCLLQVGLVMSHPLSSWKPSIDFLERWLSFKVVIDGLTLVMLLSIALVVLCSILVIVSESAHHKRGAVIFNLLLISLVGMNALVMVRDLFSLYVFLEIVAVSAFILIAINKDILALEGAFKYLLLSAVASVLMVTGLALLFMLGGGTSFALLCSALADNQGTMPPQIAIGLFLCGVFIKAGVVPFHGWLPDAYTAAPTGISLLLAGIITKVSGVYVLLRMVLSVFGFTPPLHNLLMLVGTISIFVGALAALGQNNFKRMLSYSSISQVGYIILGLGCGTPLAIAGAVLHIFNHATFKALLFSNAAALEQQTGSVEMDTMGGVAQKMPVTGFTSVVAFLSTAGIPPLSGFWSKFMIILGLWLSGSRAYSALALLASILTAAYFLSMQRRVFFGKTSAGVSSVKEASFALQLVAVVLTVIIIGVGLSFPLVAGKFILVLKHVI